MAKECVSPFVRRFVLWPQILQFQRRFYEELRKQHACECSMNCHQHPSHPTLSWLRNRMPLRCGQVLRKVTEAIDMHQKMRQTLLWRGADFPWLAFLPKQHLSAHLLPLHPLFYDLLYMLYE